MKWKTVFKSLKNSDMRKRILIVVGLITVYRFLIHIPVPITEPKKLSEVINSVISSTDFGNFLNLLSGGALTSLSILLAGLSPFITASLFTQLMVRAVPRFDEMRRDGASGMKKIQQWTRILTLPLAIAQSITFIFILRQSVLQGNTTILGETTIVEWIVAITAMAAGSMLLMWIGELMTEQGVGNGLSLLIFIGIVSQLPKMFSVLTTSIFDTSKGSLDVFGWFTVPVNPTMFFTSLTIAIFALLILYILVKINEAQRIITINHAKRIQGNSNYGGVKSILPMKLIAAGVIPVIFAVAALSLPAFIGQVLKASNINLELANNLINWFQAPNPGNFTGLSIVNFIYPASYFLLVIFFTYFYTSIVFNSTEISEDLQRQGGFIEGIRPGKQTENFLSKTMNRLILFGALALGLIAILPFIIEFIFFKLTGLQSADLAISGTGLLITVTVGLETLRHINSRALMIAYDDYK